MKLYREVKDKLLNDGTGRYVQETRLEPFEITEGEIYEILVNEIMGCDGPEKRVAAKAILSKLK